MANEEVFNKYMDEAAERKMFKINEKINDLDEKFSILVQKIEELTKKSAEKVYSSEQPLHHTQDFSSIENFARAMSALKTYENSVINGYEQLRTKAQQDALSMISDSEEEDIGDSALKFLFNRLGSAAPQNGATHTIAAAPPATQTQLYTTGDNMNKPMFDIKTAAEQIPNNIKELIKKGTIDKKTLIKDGKAAVSQKGIDVSESQLSDLYDYIKDGDSDD